MENRAVLSLKEFKKLFDTYSKRLYEIACRHVSPHDAEDIVQDLFVSIWEKREAVKIRTSWKGYLYAALKYNIFRFLDRKNELDINLRGALNEIGNSDDIKTFEELYNLLDDSIQALSPQCRTIFEKRYYENKKLQEIAEEMQLSIETVKTQIKRGLKAIRLKMKDSVAEFLFL